MPTYTVKPSGGDYTSLSAAEAARNGNHVTAAAITTIECYGMTDTTGVVIAGGTANSSFYFKVVGAGDGRHDGKWTPSAYILSPTSSASLNQQTNWTRVEGIQVENRGTLANLMGVLDTSGTGFSRYDDIIVRRTGTGTGLAGFNMSGPAAVINNCISINWVSASQGYGFSATDGCKLYNCGSIDNRYGFFAGTTNVRTSNCWAQDNLTAGWFTASGGFVGDYNLTDDAVAGHMPGANSVANESLTFINKAGLDYHLAAGDGAAIGGGTDLSADSTASLDDIDGDPRGSVWDIGPDQYIPSAGRLSPMFLRKVVY